MEKQKHFMRSLFLLIVATMLLGEISFFPFGTAFRFGLGSTVFFLGLILNPDLLRPWVGGVVGLSVVLFRVCLDLLFRHSQQHFLTVLGNHFPAFGYYFFLALFLLIFNLRRYRDLPLILGAMVSVFDFLANIIELIIREGLLWSGELGRELITASAVAFGKGFVIIGIVSIFAVYRLRIVQEEERLRLERTLLLASGLYEETFFLKKSMHNIEQITAKSFELYQKVKKEPRCEQALAYSALEVAEQVHELKKDAQRIVAGLSKLVMVKGEDAQLGLEEIFSLLIRANVDYSKSLNRAIAFSTSISQDIAISRIYPIISILNNLLSNAIEAIEGEGNIHLNAKTDTEVLEIEVSNDGPVIPEGDINLIFEPGFTSKFSSTGSASTGIGLTHVKEIVSLLHGQVEVVSTVACTKFSIKIPLLELS